MTPRSSAQAVKVPSRWPAVIGLRGQRNFYSSAGWGTVRLECRHAALRLGWGLRLAPSWAAIWFAIRPRGTKAAVSDRWQQACRRESGAQAGWLRRSSSVSERCAGSETNWALRAAATRPRHPTSTGHKESAGLEQMPHGSMPPGGASQMREPCTPWLHRSLREAIQGDVRT